MILIAAVDRNWAIGKENRLLYSLPEDMKNFRSVTSGNTVIYGRKTLQSFPGSRPLKNRKNIVISRNYQSEYDNLLVASSPKMAMELCKNDEKAVYICGGETIYRAFYPFCKTAILTQVDAVADGADAFFPNLDEERDWEVSSATEWMLSESGIRYRFVTYTNKAL